MMKTNFKLAGILLIAIFAFSITGCGKKVLKEESILDTPDNHFSRGMTEFERGNLSAALAEFERAKGCVRTRASPSRSVR